MEKLKKLRKAAKLTQKELASQVGDLTCQSISNYEKGIREPDFETLQKLAKYFNCLIDDLI